ncbi:hypothetical protein LCGC14_2585140, partial [marine sediment metagenome]
MTDIEWVKNPDGGSQGKSWNPVSGCEHLPPQCPVSADCWARKTAETRLRGRFGYPEDTPFKP